MKELHKGYPKGRPFFFACGVCCGRDTPDKRGAALQVGVLRNIPVLG